MNNEESTPVAVKPSNAFTELEQSIISIRNRLNTAVTNLADSITILIGETELVAAEGAPVELEVTVVMSRINSDCSTINRHISRLEELADRLS